MALQLVNCMQVEPPHCEGICPHYVLPKNGFVVSDSLAITLMDLMSQSQGGFSLTMHNSELRAKL